MIFMQDNVIYWAKVKKDAILPTKRDEDAGYDLYPCFEADYLMIGPHEVKMVPLGVASAFSKHRVVLLKERGSTGTKNMAQRSGVIDSGFRGEYMCPISNLNDHIILVIAKAHVILDDLPTSDIPYMLIPYEKAICQALIMELPTMECRELTYEQLKQMKSKRMEGKLGSSGK